MNKRKSEAENVVGAITDTGMVGGYQRRANTERKAAILWKVIAAGSLIGFVVFAINL